ncbi:palmitoyltransferase ZDHHC15-like [Scleropages formosus]|uniref:Palmitoyltransferase n=1 Tax=Scleropages formosus TaxID=113540 RepID=A0A0P7X4T2_SCLFO|nr:palmitoyltransferase ZDHHC15-like [Scleropages formosus]
MLTNADVAQPSAFVIERREDGRPRGAVNMALSAGLRCCQRIFSWIPVVIITSIVLWSYYAYVFELCLLAYLLVFHACFVMFSWTYWKSIFTPPFSPSKKFQLSYLDKERYELEERPDVQKQILIEIARKLPVFTRAASGGRFCDRCQVIKPDRCHHCSVCETVNNCVGFSNYKFFLLFLAYSMVYCIFIAATSFQYFLKFWVGELPNGPAKFHVLFLMFVALMFFVSLMFLFGYHCWLSGPDKNGFNLGFRSNLLQVFGEERKLWLLPIFTSLGDGHYFPMRSQSESRNPLLANEERWEEDGGSDEEGADIRGELGVIHLGLLGLLVTLDEDLADADGPAAVSQALFHGFPCRSSSQTAPSPRQVICTNCPFQLLAVLTDCPFKEPPFARTHMPTTLPSQVIRINGAHPERSSVPTAHPYRHVARADNLPILAGYPCWHVVHTNPVHLTRHPSMSSVPAAHTYS